MVFKVLKFGLAKLRAWHIRIRYYLSKAFGIKRGLRVVYYPAFHNGDDLTNHYHRACWYMQPAPDVFKSVALYVKNGIEVGARPKYMGKSLLPCEHISISAHDLLSKGADDADVILSWRNFNETEKAFPGKHIINVDTDDLHSIEYGKYCGLSWRSMPALERRSILKKHHKKFRDLFAVIRSRKSKRGVVFGTGPSIDTAYDFDFSGHLTVICNSSVQNEKLINHIAPDFICAGDTVSHFGVSLYAEKFREDLVRVLLNHDCFFLTTASFGFLFIQHHPEIADRVLLCEQRSTQPVFDLFKEWSLPQLDSTLNIHMLPLAATFSDRIYILGCDGKAPDAAKNEDFWAHSANAQYHNLVDTGHRCHPTFNINRERSTHDRFVESVRQTLEIGEQNNGKEYISLASSNTPGICERFRNNLEQGKEGLVILS